MGQITNKELKTFGLAWCVMLSLMSISHYLKGHFVVHTRLCLATFLVLLSGLFIPVLLKPIFVVLRAALRGLVWLITQIVLVIAYYCAFVPIGLIMRMVGKKVLDVDIDKEAGSYWIKKEVTCASQESLLRQW